MEDEIKIPEVRTKMCCPVSATCDHKPIWHKPVYMNNKEVNKKAVYQGHCIPHYENSHCVDTSKSCPKCVVYKKENII